MAKLVLPEKDDPRVSLAKRQLFELGYHLVEPEDFKSKELQYTEILEKERFFNKMSREAKKKIYWKRSQFEHDDAKKW